MRGSLWWFRVSILGCVLASKDLHIRWVGSENSTRDKFVAGGSVWHVSGDAMEQEGVMLLPHPTRFYDTPVLTFWQKGQYGRVFQGFGIDSRDMQIGFQIYAGWNGNAEDWRVIDSDFRLSWAYDRLGHLEFETDEGVRFLELQLLSEPDSYPDDDLNVGQDPHLRHDSSIILKVGGPNPNFQTYDTVVEKQCTGSSGSFTFDVTNDGDIEMWLRWSVSSVNADTQWTFGDPSLGCDEFLRADADSDRVWTAPKLLAGEHAVFDSDPRTEFAESSLVTNLWARCKEQLFYPIPPHTKTTIPVTYSGATTDDVCRLRFHTEFSRPFGLSRFKVVDPW